MRSRTLALPAALTAGLLAAGLVSGALAPAAISAAPAAPAAPAAAECPPGTTTERDVPLADFAAGVTSTCAPALRPEPREEVEAMAAQLAARSTGGYAVRAGALESATAQHEAIARKSAGTSASSWLPLGKGPLHSDVAGYTRTNGLGLHQLAGRIEDLSRDPANSARWFAAVANGGIWETTNSGGTWRSIGESLPTQITGAVAYLKPGVVLAGTGDPAFGGSSFSGQGIFRTTNGGKAWARSSGVPAGTLTFSFGFDPARPTTVYAATSKGLYRSADAGRTFKNVVLPTTCTDVAKPTCFFANIVTDVVVRPSERDGSKGGAVLAAVGWRAGQKPNALGKPQSPRNGLYTSATGAPGSFRYVSAPAGFAANDVVGRTALTVAQGSRQLHDYVYAVVQDAKKFNKGATTLDLPDATGGSTAAAAVLQNTVLNGLYGSKDFGKTWTKLADATQLALPGSGSALQGAQGATYAPGIQSWYNEWISVDPTVQDEAGIPGRIAFGLEEVWQGPGAIPLVPNTGRYTVAGRYFSGNACGGLIVPTLQGYCPFAADPTKPQGSTTHPDQHAGMWVPTGSGGVTLVAGNDGGAYKQVLKAGQALTNDGWGNGDNNGFNTLLPYDAAMALDGTAVMGLQDNGSAVITPSGKQIMAYGGDGFFVAIDPENSNVWWEEYTGGDIRVTTDGGKSWTNKIPTGMTSALFGTPFVMDETNPKHLAIGGRQVFETTKGQAVTGDTWSKVFDLGTRTQPGVAGATADRAAGNPDNQLSAVDTRDQATYVGYCGFCDIVTGGVPFGSGIATNVGGSKPAKAGSTDGWHIAKAKGLPKRYINSVRIDPKNARTVYVTLGGYGRRWIPPGSLGDDVSKVGKGHVYKSTDAGETFKDISGNLPDIGADDAFPFDGGLVVANDLGVYFAKTTNGGSFTVLGRNLPRAPVFRLNKSPRNSKELIAASYGRGVYRIVLPGKATLTSEDGTTRTGTAAGAPPAAAAPSAAAPRPVAEGSTAPATVDTATRAVADSRPFYRSPAAPVALIALLGLFVALALRRRRTPG
ncbi:MAG: hypothetical protein JWN77_1907 [Frankiales bacterium]|nr:hypothetical protein [Frankiales bacterium]